MHPTAEQLLAGIEEVKRSPRDRGRLEAIVVRPATDQRLSLESCQMDLLRGAAGDRWEQLHASPLLPDSQVLDSQVTLMNARAANLVAGTRERWLLAGDQMVVDFDLSVDHLAPGDRIQIGDVILEVTPKAHNGCRKFAARFGEAAIAWVNSPEGRHLHLRGIYVKVIVPGEVRVGDSIQKIASKE